MLRIAHRILGTVALVALSAYSFLKDTAPMKSLGEGGSERWIVYAVVLWLVVLGSALIGGSAGRRATR